MLLRTGVTVKTAPPAATPPWSCVWRNRDGLRCHVGRVYDPELFNDGATEYSQKQFPRKKPSSMSLIGGAVIPIAPDINMSKASGEGFKTSSVKIYYNTEFGKAIYDSDDLEEVPESGYAYWPESKFRSQGGKVYVILSKIKWEEGDEVEDEGPKWVLSLELEENILKNDFKIACIARTSCIQIWQSDIVYSRYEPDDYPFKVKSENGNISVVPGWIRGHMCEASGTYADGTWHVIGSATFNGEYGNVGSASVTIQNSVPQDEDLTGYITIATVIVNQQQGDKVIQAVSGSQFVDRFKCSNVGTATYFWNLT